MQEVVASSKKEIAKEQAIVMALEFLILRVPVVWRGRWTASRFVGEIIPQIATKCAV